MVNLGKYTIHGCYWGWYLWRLELFHQGVCNSWTTLFPPMQWQRVPYTMHFRRGSVSPVLNQNHLEDLFTFDSNPRGSFGYGTDIVTRKMYIDIIMCEFILNLCWFDFRCVYNTCVYNTYIYLIHMFFLVYIRYFRFVVFLPVFAQWTCVKVAFYQAVLCDVDLWGKKNYGRSLGITTEHLKGCSSGLFQMSRQIHILCVHVWIENCWLFFIQDRKHWFVSG